MGGHQDKIKHLFVHTASTIQPHCIRLLLVLAWALNFEYWTNDVTQASLYSIDPVLCDILVTEIELDTEQCLKFMKLLYGIFDAGDLWASTTDKQHRMDLQMKPLRSEPAFYVHHHNGEIQGFSRSYVDDLLRAGTPRFFEQCRKTLDSFEMGDAYRFLYRKRREWRFFSDPENVLFATWGTTVEC